nr:LOW QUALITY PROTEIN: glycoprotein-N-acetylgalactosamine 3-beta-galactosyltransferase 1-B-like [Megalopta genalis]
MYLNCVKPRSTFMVGYGIGFLGTLFVFIFHDAFSVRSTCVSTLPSSGLDRRSTLLKWLVDTWNDEEETVIQAWKDQPSGQNPTYNEWLKSVNMRVDKVDLDSYLYGAKKKNEKLESDWLGSNVRITCVIFVTKVKLARSIWHTWGTRCNNIYFFGKEKDVLVPIITFDTKLVSSWQLLCEAFNYVWKSNENLEWVVSVKDDTLVIPENLRYMLAPLNHTDDHYLGHTVVLWGQPYNVANAGYVISMGVLRKLVDMFDNSEKCITGGKYWKQEDYYLAKHLASMGIYPSDTRDQRLRGTFHGYSLQSLLWGIVKTGSYWTRALYPIRNECCSFMSVTFNVGEPDKMYTLNYLLYHLHVLKRKSVFGAKRPLMVIPDKDVWKIALEEEFNITHLNNISSDAYYEIWHSKYSEPEQLMSKDYQRKLYDRTI